MARTQPEELIRRYEAGNRDPELIRLLNEAAWDGFHDPWEPPVRKGRHPVTGLRVPVPEPAIDPEALLPFTGDTIRRFLEERPYKSWRYKQHAFLVSFEYNERTDRCLTATFVVEGRKDDIFKLRIASDRRVPAERFDRALRLCNAWNDGYRWPRAILEMPKLDKDADEPEGREPASALLTLDLQLFLRQGIPQRLFNAMVKDALDTSWTFWELAHDDYGL